jgi:LmbE family N-acetylglucosaminyl deacetylase
MDAQQRAVATPLYELLETVPPKTRLVVDDEDGMGTSFIPVGRLCHEAAAALRQLLEQPEPVQEPVTWGVHDQIALTKAIQSAPPAQPAVPLTDEQIDQIMQPLTQGVPYSWRAFARAIEAAHGITAAPTGDKLTPAEMVRPQNCGTGYCSCIECHFKEGGA